MSQKPKPVEALTDSEIADRNRFIDEYLKDFDIKNTCTRTGISASSARAYLKEQYVAGMVHDKMRSVPEDTIITRQEVLSNLKRLAYTARSEQHRLRAWEKLAKLMGMEVEYIKAEVNTGKENPLIDETMTAKEAAELYAREVLGKG